MQVLRVRGGELAGTGSWVYVWLRAGERDHPVVYVGGTGLPPAVRTWLHLHDSDPDVGRLAARYPAGPRPVPEAAVELADRVAAAVVAHARG